MAGDRVAWPCARRSGRGRAGLAPGRAFWLSELVLSSRCFIYYCCFFNGRSRPRPNPKGRRGVMGGGQGRPPGSWSPVARLLGAGLPFCHRGCCRCWGGGRRLLRHRPDGPGPGDSRGSRSQGPPPPVVLWAPMPVPSLCQLPEALLERRGGRGSVG